MADPFINTQFSPGTVISSGWLNGINDSVLDLTTTVDILTGQTIQFSVTNVAALRLVDATKYTAVNTLGYYTAGDGGQGAYRYDSTDTTSADNGGSVIVGLAGARWKLQEVAGIVNVKQWGAKGDDNNLNGTGTNDTASIVAALAYIHNEFKTLYFPAGCYDVTSISLTGYNYNVHFENAFLYGVATTPTDALLTMIDFATHRVTGVQLRTDGNAATPIYHPNYTCALRMRSTAASPDTQFVRINSLRIWYFHTGIVNGNHVGEAPQPDYTQSEIWIDDYQVRGVLRPFYGNLINSYVIFTNSGFIAQQFESTGWWVDADGWCLRNDNSGSEVQCIGCEFQRAIIPGYTIYGNKITIIDPVWEVSSPCYVAGDQTYRGGIDNFFGPGGVEPFIVAPTAEGVLLLDGFTLRRPPGTANFDRTRFVDAADNVNFRIKLHSCKLKEWSFDLPNGAGDLIHGGRLICSDLFIDNSTGTAPSYEIDPKSNVLVGIDRTGNSFPSSGVTTPQGGWTVIAGAANGAYANNSTNLPPGGSAWIYTSTDATGGFTFQTTNGFQVQGGKDYLVDMWLRVFSFTGSSTWQCAIEWFDYSGASITLDQIMLLDAGTLGDWNSKVLRYRAPATAPSQAVTAKMRFVVGPSMAIGINDITMS